MSTQTKIIPKISDLYADVELMQKSDELTVLLNQHPKPEWVKKHPMIANYSYLPIDKVEFLLKMIFKKYRIEVLREGTAHNGVYVVVRVHYLNPVTSEWDFHDGIGAKELQTAKGASAADLSQITSAALTMAFPIAKTIAIKDACDHFGRLFGADLNKRDVIEIRPDKNLQNKTIENLNNLVTKPELKPAEEFSQEEANKIEVKEPELLTQFKEFNGETFVNIHDPGQFQATVIKTPTRNSNDDEWE